MICFRSTYYSLHNVEKIAACLQLITHKAVSDKHKSKSHPATGAMAAFRRDCQVGHREGCMHFNLCMPEPHNGSIPPTYLDRRNVAVCVCKHPFAWRNVQHTMSSACVACWRCLIGSFPHEWLSFNRTAHPTAPTLPATNACR